MRWTDELGAREFCPRTWTVRIVPAPLRPLSHAEEMALADLTRGCDDAQEDQE